MPKFLTPPGIESIYTASERWTADCLVADGSLFSPGDSVWTLGNIQDLHRRMMDDPLRGSASFLEKLNRQLEGAPREVFLLAAEVLFIHVLVTNELKTETKRALVEAPLTMGNVNVAIPEDLLLALNQGLVSPGTSFMVRRPNQLGFIMSFAARLKEQPPSDRARLLGDKGNVRELLMAVPVNSAFTQREALLHLLMPSEFEAIVSREHKRRIAAAFKHLVNDSAADIDAQLAEIRYGLTPRFGNDPRLFYLDQVRDTWLSDSSGHWTAFIDWARRFKDASDFDQTERDYKLALGERLRQMRSDVESGDPGWAQAFRRCFGPPNNLTTWRQHEPLRRLATTDPARLKSALMKLWDKESPVFERVFGFWEQLADLAVGGPGGQANLASYLLMADGPELLPPFQATPYSATAKLVGFDSPEEGAGAAERYTNGLELCDAVIREAKVRGLFLRDRLDAQSLIWCVTRYPLDASPVSDWSELDRAALSKYRGAQMSNSPVAWMEKLSAHGNDRVFPIGSMLACPKRSVSGADVYRAIRDVRAGDRVLHLADGAIVGTSIAAGPHVETKEVPGHEGEAWYRLPLRDYRALQPPMTQSFMTSSFGEALKEYSARRRSNLFFSVNKGEISFDGLWLTGVDAELFALLESGYAELTGRGLVDDVEHSGSFDGSWQPRAETCYMPVDELLGLRAQLLTRKQLVFYGPPGTGKTFVAQQLAEGLAEESGGRSQLVQFHPSYSYEDFVEGLKPRLVSGNIQYEVEAGVLLELAAEARAKPTANFILVVDEINRANLPKVFGELFFLLEYRDKEVQLPYSRAKFSLPQNVYVIGTMNTADRSIAIVDFALRRRFGFIGFFPTAAQAVLRTYLKKHAPEFEYLADALNVLNNRIGDRNYALGQSYFMPRDPNLLTEAYLADVWRYSIEPYLEEYWFDRPDELGKNSFDALKKAVLTSPPQAPERLSDGEPTE